MGQQLQRALREALASPHAATALPVAAAVGTALALPLLALTYHTGGRLLTLWSTFSWYARWQPTMQTKNFYRPGAAFVQLLQGSVTSFLRPPPSVWLVGESKCGTTSVFHYIGQHPNLIQGIGKACKLWDSRNIFHLEFIGRKYHALMRYSFPTYFTYWMKKLQSPCGNLPVMCMDGTATNMGYPWTAKAIKEFCDGWHKPKDIKILVVIRDPVARAISQYTYERARGKDHNADVREAMEAYHKEDAWFWEKTWPKCVQDGSLKPMYQEHPDARAQMGDPNHRETDKFCYLKRGHYAEHIRRYVEVFGRANVYIEPLDSVMKDTLSSTNRILAWLGLTPLKTVDVEKKNQTKIAKPDVPKALEEDMARSLLPEMIALKKEFGIAEAEVWMRKYLPEAELVGKF